MSIFKIESLETYPLYKSLSLKNRINFRSASMMNIDSCSPSSCCCGVLTAPNVKTKFEVDSIYSKMEKARSTRAFYGREIFGHAV